MKAAILQCDWVMEDLRDQFGEYPAMIEAMFHEVDSSISFDIFDVQQGHYPSDLDEYDFFVTTGSRAGVYEDLPWIEPLIDFIRLLNARRCKLVGICFGHQIIAQALGGCATKSDKGWGIGIASNEITARPNWLQPDASKLNLLVSHQDQVVTLPQSAKVIAGSDFCPYFMVQWNDHFISVQGHPEWQADYSHALINIRQNSYSKNQRQKAIESLKQTPNNHLFTQWILSFLEQSG